MNIFSILRTLTVCICLVSPLAADVVVTRDGSRLVGRIVQLAEGRLTIETQIAGTLELDAAQIVSLATDSPMKVRFASGDVLVGTIELAEGSEQPVMHTALGHIPIPAEQLAVIWAPDQQDPEVAAQIAAIQKQRDALDPKWSFIGEIGASATEGNTDTAALRGRLDLKRKTPKDQLHFYLSADYAEQNDRRNRNEYKAGTRYDYELTSRWDWYVRSELEYDEFEDLDLRAIATSGVAYNWIKKEDHLLKTGIGAGYRHEAYGTGVTRDQAILDLGLDYRVDLAKWVQFAHSAQYSPDVEDFDFYRLYFDTAFVFPLSREDIKMKLGMINEYNSRPVAGNKELDNKYYANLVFQIK